MPKIIYDDGYFSIISFVDDGKALEQANKLGFNKLYSFEYHEDKLSTKIEKHALGINRTLGQYYCTLDTLQLKDELKKHLRDSEISFNMFEVGKLLTTLTSCADNEDKPTDQMEYLDICMGDSLTLDFECKPNNNVGRPRGVCTIGM